MRNKNRAANEIPEEYTKFEEYISQYNFEEKSVEELVMFADQMKIKRRKMFEFIRHPDSSSNESSDSESQN